MMMSFLHMVVIAFITLIILGWIRIIREVSGEKEKEDE